MPLLTGQSEATLKYCGQVKHSHCSTTVRYPITDTTPMRLLHKN